MKKNLWITLLALIGFGHSSAQSVTTLKLWEGTEMPDSNGITEPETDIGGKRLANITVPELTIYHPNPEKNTGIAVLICPGGGYAIVASEHEGHMYAQFLAQNGITGIVLKYRLPNKVHTVPFSDVAQAMTLIQAHAKEWSIKKNKIGISGFSAGGHLAAAYTAHASQKLHPDFCVLFYPVISFGPLTHEGSRQNLTGGDSSLFDYYSVEKQVTKKFPPTLIFVSDDDTAVPPENSYNLKNQLEQAGVPVKLINYPTGGHGWGFNDSFEYHKSMKEELIKFLKKQ